MATPGATRRNINVYQYSTVPCHKFVSSIGYMAYYRSLCRPHLIEHESQTAVLMDMDGFPSTTLRSCSGYVAKITAALYISVSLTECYIDVAVCCAGLLNKFKHIPLCPR